MTTKQPIANKDFSIDKLFLGERNAKVINRFYKNFDSVSGLRIMAYLSPIGIVDTFIGKPTANCKFRIKGSGATTADIKLTYVDIDGKEDSVILTSDGTNWVETDEALGIMINDVEVHSGSTGASDIEVWIDNNNDGDFDTRLGNLLSGYPWQSSIYLVPKGRRLIVREYTILNTNSVVTYLIRLQKIKNWLNGNTAITIESFENYFWNGQVSSKTKYPYCVYEEGDLCYFRVQTSGGSQLEGSYQYIVFDK